MVYEAAKLRVNRLRHSSVPCLEHLITSSHTDSLSMGLEIGFMTPTDAAKEPNHRSMPPHDMGFNRTVQRTLKPNLGKCFDSQAASPRVTHSRKRPRGVFTQAYEQGDSSRLGLLQGFTEKPGRSEEAVRQTMSRRPFSKYAGGSITVSINPNLFGEAVPG